MADYKEMYEKLLNHITEIAKQIEAIRNEADTMYTMARLEEIARERENNNEPTTNTFY